MEDQLNRATATIERQLQEINELQDEVSRLRIRQEMSAQEFAEALVQQAIAETKKGHGRSVNPVILSWLVKVGRREYWIRMSER